MNRSSGLQLGKYTRMSGAQQHLQAAHTSSSLATRSSSVLGSLMRMRNQFHRLRHAQQRQAITTVLARYQAQAVVRTPARTPSTPGQIDVDNPVDEAGSGDACSSTTPSVLQNAIALCTEALRLLNGEVRGKDNLSDLPRNSPAYGSEIGKLLKAAADFGASTTFPRVKQALHWILLNKELLHTPRQVMSLCMPLISLSDGPTAGVAFVLDELYEPLLLALQDVAISSTGSAAESADGASSNATTVVQQHLVAITSAMNMVAKWSALRLSSKPQESATPSLLEGHTTAKSEAAAEELEKMLRIAEACVAALRRLCDRCSRSDSHEAAAAIAHLSPADVLQWIQCLHGLEKMYLLAAPTLEVSREQAEAASRRTLTCHRALLPLVQRTLELAGSGTACSATSTVGLTATSVRVPDVVELIQVGLQASIEPTHGELMLSYGLQALPGALSSATVKDLSDVVQVVNRVRQQRPSALPAALLLSIQAGVRPALFLLRETHAVQLRASDCGVLLSSLSRWEEVPGVTVSADIVELLSQRFGEQMHVVGASQLVPFVLSLARLEERQLQPLRGGAAGEAAEGAAELGENMAGGGVQLNTLGVAWEPAGIAEDSLTSSPLRIEGRRGAAVARYRFCTTSRVVAQCVQRAIALAGDNETKSEATAPPRLAAIEAAHLLASFVQLCAPQCVEFFHKVEPLLATAVQGNAGLPSSASEAIRLRVVAGDAVQRFARYTARQCEQTSAQHSSPTTQETREEAAAVEVQRATVLLKGMSRGLTKLVRDAASSKDLVLACSLLRRRLLGKRAGAGVVVGGSEDALKYPENTLIAAAARTRAKASSRTWTRKEVKLATVFAEQAVKVTPKCKGVELGVLASVASSLCTAGALPRPAAQQLMRTMWARCADGLAVASSGEAAGPETASALLLSLDNCKALMDACRSTHTSRTAPPVIFLEVLAAQCGELLKGGAGSVAGEESSAAARGTARAYADAATKLHRISDLGRSLVSYFGSLRPPLGAGEGDAVMQSSPWREALVAVLESYLAVVHSVMEAYAMEATLSETWCAEPNGGSPPPLPLELLSTIANVMAQIYRLARRGVGSTKLSSSIPATVPAVPDEVLSVEGDAVDGSLILDDGTGGETLSELGSKALEDDVEPLPVSGTSPVSFSTATLDKEVRETLGLIGDTIVALARQRQQLSSSVSVNMPAEPAADDDCGRLTAAPAHALVQNAKHLLMLLQAFEIVQYTHLDMLYSVLPELRGCADRLDPLELSLLIRALTQLGAWNSRLLGALAAAVASKMNQCELRQCYTLLRGLCRSGCISADTYVELRSAPHKDWDSGHGGASRKAATQDPLQRLAENTLHRLDTFVRTKDAFMSLARTAAVADLVGVVNALRFFHAPPPMTHDAFVVLAVRKLAFQPQHLPLRSVVQHTVALLDAVSELRQPEQQRVSSQALWTVLRRAFASSIEAGAPDALTGAAGSAICDALHLHACWELTRFSALHSLQYGRAATRNFFAPIVATTTEQHGVSCATVTQARLGRLIESRASDIPAGACSPSPPSTAADRAALRRYALHASPCLVRGDRELDPYVRAPLKLARLIADGDPTKLVHAVTTAAPAAQTRRYIRMLACLLRSDLWAPSISAATPDTQLLAVALQRLWRAAGLQSLLHYSPGAFSTEELLVLAAAADRVHQYSADAETSQKDCAVAMCQLCAATTEWRLPVAVDAWMLFAMPLMASSSMPAAPLPRCSDELFSMLVVSGDVLVTRFAHAQRSWATSGARILPELLRLFLGPGQLDVAILHAEAVDGDTRSFRSHNTAAGAPAAQARFVEVYKELLCRFTSCLAGTHGIVPG